MAGPLLCGFVALPIFGIQKTLLACAAGYMAAGLAVLVAGDRRVTPRLAGGTLVLCGVLAALALAPEQIVSEAYHRRGGEMLRYEEDVDGSVAVLLQHEPAEDFRQ